MSNEKSFKQRALDLYTPPFRFDYGYIFDSKGQMVADNESGEDGEVDCPNGNLALRVRGWGRISYMEEPEKLQDTVGELMVEALNEYWEKNKS